MASGVDREAVEKLLGRWKVFREISQERGAAMRRLRASHPKMLNLLAVTNGLILYAIGATTTVREVLDDSLYHYCKGRFDAAVAQITRLLDSKPDEITEVIRDLLVKELRLK